MGPEHDFVSSALFAVHGQGTLLICGRRTGLELLALGRVENTFARGASLGRALVEGLAVVIRRSVEVQRQGAGGLEGVGHPVETNGVGHVGDLVAVQGGFTLDGHGFGLVPFVITVIAAQTGVGVLRVVDDLVGPVVLGFLELTIKDLHDAVGASMVMDSTGKRKKWQQKRDGRTSVW